ncbi:hypothetical protein [Pontibacillus marinus]|nr:hypothetical protein [Pontibacillus marinus]
MAVILVGIGSYSNVTVEKMNQSFDIGPIQIMKDPDTGGMG